MGLECFFIHSHEGLFVNILVVISFMLAAAVVGWAALSSTDNPKSFIDPHGLVIVIAGSIVATITDCP